MKQENNLTINEMKYLESVIGEKIYNCANVEHKELEWMPDWAGALQWTQLKRLERILELLDKNINNKIIVDLGCFIGGFTKIMAEYAKNNNGIVYSVDNFKTMTDTYNPEVEYLFKKNMEVRGYKDFIKLMINDSIEASKYFKDNSIDFIFIDAGHRYKDVKQDIEKWYPKIKIGGIISGHDYEQSTYDENFIDMDGDNSIHHGVIKAVNEKLRIVNFEETIFYKIKI